MAKKRRRAPGAGVRTPRRADAARSSAPSTARSTTGSPTPDAARPAKGSSPADAARPSKARSGAADARPSKGAAARRGDPDRHRRRLLLRGGLVLAAAVPAALLLHRHDVQARELHDLGVIGDGRPVVVQVHDPSCPSCRRLKGNTETALEDFPDLRYRIADLTETEGRAFGAEHGVGKVTLLLFDGRGRHVDTVSGVTPVETLRERFARIAGAAS